MASRRPGCSLTQGCSGPFGVALLTATVSLLTATPGLAQGAAPGPAASAAPEAVPSPKTVSDETAPVGSATTSAPVSDQPTSATTASPLTAPLQAPPAAAPSATPAARSWLRQTPEKGAVATAPSTTPSPFRSLIVLLVLGGLGGAAFWMKRRKHVAATVKGGDGMRILSAVKVGPKAQLVLTEVGGRKLLLGVTEQAVQRISWMDDDPDLGVDAVMDDSDTALPVRPDPAPAPVAATPPVEETAPMPGQAAGLLATMARSRPDSGRPFTPTLPLSALEAAVAAADDGDDEADAPAQAPAPRPRPARKATTPAPSFKDLVLGALTEPAAPRPKAAAKKRTTTRRKAKTAAPKPAPAPPQETVASMILAEQEQDVVYGGIEGQASSLADRFAAARALHDQGSR